MSVSTVRTGISPSVGNKFLKMMLLIGIPFGLFMGILWSFQYGAKSGVVMGIISGVLFGALMGAFAGYQKKKVETERPSFAGEDLVKEGGANHFSNIEAVGGWIYLTDQRLLFKSHSINVQRHELSIPLQNISEAKPCRTFAIIPNGLKIKTIDGNTEKCVVEDRKNWVKKILEAKERIAGSSQEG